MMVWGDRCAAGSAEHAKCRGVGLLRSGLAAPAWLRPPSPPTPPVDSRAPARTGKGRYYPLGGAIAVVIIAIKSIFSCWWRGDRVTDGGLCA